MTIDVTKPFRRLAPSAEPEINVETGRATFIFNTEDVGRDGHIVRNAGIRIENYRSNPTILFAHDDKAPPVGRATSVMVSEPASKVEIEFTSRDLYPFGATIGDLVRARYLNACSMSWQPIKWRFRDAKNGLGGGVLFDEVDLLEISIVPVPALPEAIATARSHGIDTQPLYEWAERLLDSGGLTVVPRVELETLRRASKMPTPTRGSKSDEWKVGASRDLPVEDDDSWDGAAAEKAIFEWAGGDEFDPAKARKGFLFYNAAEPEKRGSYKDPIAHVVGGELKVPRGAIRAAASRLPQTDVPEEVKTRAESVLNAYKEKAGIGDDSSRALRAKHERALKRAPAVPTFRRGLYDVAQLACLLEQLCYAHSCSEYEAALEGDSSPVPGMIGEALVKLGESLIAMTEEEVKELLDESVEGDDAEDEDVETRSLTATDRAYIAAGATSRARAWRAGIAVARAGKVLSSSNEKKLEEAHAHNERALKHHGAVADHQKAASGHLDEAQARHLRAAGTLEELGEHVRAAQENPDEAKGHLERAMRSYRSATDQMGAIAESHEDTDESLEDLGDSHQSMGRSVKRAQRSIRSVIDGSHSGETGEDDSENTEAAKERRLRHAKALKIRGQTAA